MKKAFRIIMMLALVAILSACGNGNNNAPSDNNQGSASIIGKWKGVRMTENGVFDEGGTEYLQEFSWEFNEDGTTQGFVDDVEFGKPAPYILEGDQLTTKGGGMTASSIYTVTTLTKKKLVLEQVIGGDTQTEEFERVK